MLTRFLQWNRGHYTRTLLSLCLLVIAGTFLYPGSYVRRHVPIALIQARRHTLAPTPLVNAQNVVVHSTSDPDEAAVASGTYQSTATGDEPSAISLPTIGASGSIEQVGIDQNHQIAVPTNIHLAGWYVNSVTPGQLGLSIIDGHIDGTRYPGIFEHLAQLKVGDHFEVDLATGDKQTYVVRQLHVQPIAQTAAVLFSQIPGVARQLNLITCGGTFSRSAGMYNDRVVVQAQYLGLLPTTQ